MEIRLISAQLADTRLTLGCAELGKTTILLSQVIFIIGGSGFIFYIIITVISSISGSSNCQAQHSPMLA